MFANFEALEADFRREYRYDLRECLWGATRVGARYLLTLIRGLSPRSSLNRKLTSRGNDWSSTEELLASLIEQVDLGNRLFFMANAKHGSKVWKPMHIPRPTVKPRPISTSDEVRRFFGGGMGKVEVKR